MTLYDNFKKATLTAVVAAALSLGLSLPASASLIGDTITITSQANAPLDTWIDNDVEVVDPGIELAGGDSSNHANTFQDQGYAALFPGDFIDVGANSVTFNFAALGGAQFLYAFTTEFSDLDWVGTPGTLVGVALSDPNNSTVVAYNLETFTSNSFQFQGTVDLAVGANFTVNLTAVHVPEPSTLTFAALALLGLLAHGHHRRRA